MIMNKETTATFIGHSNCIGIDKEQLEKEIHALIQNGVTVFISGGMGSFDLMCARMVMEMKKEFPHIGNFLVIPYLNFKIARPEYYDKSIFPEELDPAPYRVAIPRRNKYLVGNSAYAICFVHRISGGSYKTFEYAKTRDISIINIRQKK